MHQPTPTPMPAPYDTEDILGRHLEQRWLEDCQLSTSLPCSRESACKYLFADGFGTPDPRHAPEASSSDSQWLLCLPPIAILTAASWKKRKGSVKMTKNT